MGYVTGLFRSVCLLVVAAGAASAPAATRFDFTAEAPTYSYTGRVALDGERSRIDMTSGNHPLFNSGITLITRKKGDDIIVVDHSRKTFFQRFPPENMRGPLATAAGIGRSEVVSSSVTKRRELLAGPGNIERHTIRADYTLNMEVDGEKMGATVSVVAEFDIDPSISQRAHPWGLQHAAKTGFPRIDNAIARRIPDRLPIRQVVTASRTIEGGPVITETFTVLVSNVAEEEFDSRGFFAPAGYQYEEPVFSFGQ